MQCRSFEFTTRDNSGAIEVQTSTSVIAAIDPLSDPAWRLAWSTVLTVVGIAAGLIFARTRIKPDHQSTWTRAMIGAVVVFGWMLVAYAIWPDAFIQFADANLLWTRDQFFWGNATDGGFPFAVTKQAVRDVVVVIMYTIVGVANCACFIMWQKRKPVEVVEPGDDEAPVVKTSRFGRPVRKATAS